MEDLIRGAKSRVMAVLVRAFGLDMTEDAFSDAVVKALEAWPQTGTPEQPTAWLTTVAKNAARDRLRHVKVREAKTLLLGDDNVSEPESVEAVSDSQLRLMFTCCHPALSPEMQVTLTLKVIAGTAEIARAFLLPETTIAQRLVRAKRAIEDAGLAYAVPGRKELGARTAAVLAVIYAIFNEGYAGRDGELMRLDLQAEALRLSRSLCDLTPREPAVFALHA